MVYIRNALNPINLLDIQQAFNLRNLEVVINRIKIKYMTGYYIVVGIYRPPNSGSNWFLLFEELVASLLPLGKLIILGDLNCDLLQPNASSTAKLCMSLDLAEVHVPVILPTRICDTRSSCLDIIAINNELHCLSYYTRSDSSSDHLPVTAVLNSPCDRVIKPIVKRSMRKANMTSLRAKVSNMELSGNLEDPDELLTSFYSQLTDILNEEVPLREFPCKKRNLPWIDNRIKSLLSHRNKLTRKVKKSVIPRQALLEELKLTKKRIRSQFRSAAKKYGEKLLGDADSKNAWRFIRQVSFTETKSSSITPNVIEINEYFASIVNDPGKNQLINYNSCDRENALVLAPCSTSVVLDSLRRVKATNTLSADGLSGSIIKPLADQLAPALTLIYNASLTSGIFPSMWKSANICPVYKLKGPKHDPSNYRPISILPIFGRCLEKIVARQLTGFCEINTILPDEQFGFRKNSSCEVALLSAVDEWLSAIDDGDYVGALLIDLSKAFDSVPHQALLKELHSINVGSEALKWFSSYLENRFQRVVTQDIIADFRPVSRGVPQGSCLSPILFNIFIRDLPSSSRCKTFQFADDVTEYSRSKSLESIKQELVLSFEDTKRYCANKGLTINASKTQFIVLKAPSKKLEADFNLTIDEVPLTPLPAVKLLGFTIDRHLTFSPHINLILKKCHGILGIMRRVAMQLPKKLLLLMYTALIRPHLEYASAILESASNTNKQKLEVIQKIASRIICNCPRDAHAAPLLEELQLNSLESRRKLHINDIVSKCLNNNAHPALSRLFSTEDGVMTATADNRTRAGGRRFSNIGRQIWGEINYPTTHLNS